MTKTAGRIVGAALLVAGLMAAGCGGANPPDPPPPKSATVKTAAHDVTVPGMPVPIQAGPIEGVHEQIVGRGVRAAVILTGPHPRADRPAVIFLHLWVLATPLTYADWIRHLTARGSTVIFPIYQTASTGTGSLLDNARAGIAAAVRALPSAPRKVIVVGHTSGGALAFDYAATAKTAGLPVPQAVVAVFPGRNAGHGRLVPPVDASKIAADTKILVIDSKGNPVGQGHLWAKAAVRAASNVPAMRRRLLVVPDMRGNGPTEGDKAAQRSFWEPVDRLIDGLTVARNPS